MTPIGKFAKVLLALTVAATVMVGLSGCKKEEAAAPTSAPSTATQTTTAKAPAAAQPKVAEDGTQVVEIRVTQNGYEPSPVTLKKGQPVEVRVTRDTERTCATEFILDEHQINEKLPVGQTVTIRFTPEKDGELRYGCHMDKMISGRFIVQ